MDLQLRAKKWFERAKTENNEIIKFVLLYIALDAKTRGPNYEAIIGLNNKNSLKKHFFLKIGEEDLKTLVVEL